MAVNQTRTLTIQTVVTLIPKTNSEGLPVFVATAVLTGDVGGGFCRAIVERDRPDEAIACAIGFACDGIKVG